MSHETTASSSKSSSDPSRQPKTTGEKLPGQLTWFDVFSLFFLASLFGFGLAVGLVYVLRSVL